MNLTDQYKKLLNRSASVLNIYHKDLDGCASSVVVKNIFKNVEYKDLRYGFVNEYMSRVDYSKYDVVLLTDISPETAEPFSYSDNIFLLDHHDTAVEYHNPEKNRIVMTGNSAAHLCKEFFENLYGIDLSYLNDFCNAVNDYDMWINKIPEGWMLNELYFKLWDEKFRARFRGGNIQLSNDETEYIKTRKKLLNEKFNELILYNCDHINGCFFISTNFINDLCHKLLSEKGFDLVVCVNPKTKNCSVRTSERIPVHIGEILKQVDLGGGHSHAGGFVVEEISQSEDMIMKIERQIISSYPELKKRN